MRSMRKQGPVEEGVLMPQRDLVSNVRIKRISSSKIASGTCQSHNLRLEIRIFKLLGFELAVRNHWDHIIKFFLKP